MKYAIKLVYVSNIVADSYIRFDRRYGDMTYYMANSFSSDCLLDSKYVALIHYKRIRDNNTATELRLVEMTDLEAFRMILDGKERGYEVDTYFDSNNQSNV